MLLCRKSWVVGTMANHPACVPTPVDGSKLRVTGIAAVAKVLGVEAGEIGDAAGEVGGR
jgi:hypothetical protein